jgi:hypothetical protein
MLHDQSATGTIFSSFLHTYTHEEWGTGTIFTMFSSFRINKFFFPSYNTTLTIFNFFRGNLAIFGPVFAGKLQYVSPQVSRYHVTWVLSKCHATMSHESSPSVTLPCHMSWQTHSEFSVIKKWKLYCTSRTSPCLLVC